MGLTCPAGASVSDGTETELCMLKYPSVDETLKLILHQKQATELANLNTESTNRIGPVHPTNRLLVEMEWSNKIYVDTAFNAIADALK